MRYIVLLVKIALLVLLAFIRLDEIDLLPFFEGMKYRRELIFYVKSLAGVGMFLLLADIARTIIVGSYRRRHKLRGEDNFTIGVGHIFQILVGFAVISGVLSLFKVDTKEVLTSLSIFFAGLALITKDYISNVLNGMILTFSGQIKIGDQVKIGEHRGKITDITLSNIHLLNDDDDYITIPNNTVFTSEVINYTRREVKKTSIEFEIDLRFFDTVEELENDLKKTLEPYAHLIRPTSYYLRVFEIGQEKVSMKFQYILDKPDRDLEREIRRKTTRRIIALINDREKESGRK